MTRCNVLHLALNMIQIYDQSRSVKDVKSHERTIENGK